ncbi:trimeric intracellular cation channel family protein [Velocimicrobium porci]|uniref:Trimeric intracellular cation channel family protein n=1 Tax=Velocimicrobium porci TaxID=2606634 RepID=A0A6L5XXP5_9FIRM|nr:trimeric intracellular cation channel family protein [Velocimicrobium porci]MSS63404.1 trimeric intracellular cation channel family protein [Velocimicrobium porci]
MEYSEVITFVLEIVGTIAFASSGAMVGIERNMDVFGVNVLGIATAVGGGMIRDLILGIAPPNMFRNPVYALVSIVTCCCLFFIVFMNEKFLSSRFRTTYDRIMMMFDAIGLGIFTAVGVNTAIKAGFANQTFLLIFVGMITGVGGGLLRDVMAGVTPYILVKHIYACASMVGAIICVILYREFGEIPAMFLSAFVVMLIRFLAAKYRWNLPRIR